MAFEILDVPANYKGLEHQQAALIYLWERLTPQERDRFTLIWRDQLPYLSQDQPSETLLVLVRYFEGFRSSAYQDLVGVWTIGYGRTQGVRKGQKTIREKEDQYLREVLSEIKYALRAVLRPNTYEHELEAITSLAYNCGIDAIKRSTLVKLHNTSDTLGAAVQFEKWIHAGGAVVQGLVNRRAAERKLYMGIVWTPPTSTRSSN